MVEIVKRLLKHKKITTFFVLIVFLLLADYVHFLSICYKYSVLSAKGMEALAPVREKEMIVVLTGDRKRIPEAIDLLLARRGSLLLISGAGRGATLTDLVNSQDARGAKAREVWNQILVESVSTSTIENAVESGKIIRSKGSARVILVTSEYHMLRSLLTFRNLSGGPEYIAYPTPSEFTAFLNGDLTSVFTAFIKTTWEYCKYFVFRNYFLGHFYD